jgi:hypothetical protein
MKRIRVATFESVEEACAAVPPKQRRKLYTLHTDDGRVAIAQKQAVLSSKSKVDNVFDMLALSRKRAHTKSNSPDEYAWERIVVKHTHGGERDLHSFLTRSESSVRAHVAPVHSEFTHGRNLRKGATSHSVKVTTYVDAFSLPKLAPRKLSKVSDDIRVEMIDFSNTRSLTERAEYVVDYRDTDYTRAQNIIREHTFHDFDKNIVPLKPKK